MKLSRLLQSGTVFLLLAVTALAQGKPAGTRRLTIEDTLEWRMASRPALSPDGKFVAYIVSENDLERSRVTSQLWRVCVAQADWQLQHPAAGEIRAMAKLGNTSLSILISMGGRPTANALRLVGARGTAHVDLFHGFAVLERGEVSRARKIAHPFAFAGGTLVSATTNLVARAVRGEPAYPGLRELVRRFYLAAQGKGEPPIRKEEILDVAEARDALLAHMPAPGR